MLHRLHWQNKEHDLGTLVYKKYSEAAGPVRKENINGVAPMDGIGQRTVVHKCQYIVIHASARWSSDVARTGSTSGRVSADMR